MDEMASYTTLDIIESIESRFKEVANLEGDFSLMPMPKEYQLQVIKNKEKSDSFGEVFTPIWLVDSMLENISNFDWRSQNKSTMDLCAGYGQFTVRMLRKKYDIMGENFDVKKFLFKTHYFSELQWSSCYKLLHIYSPKINLFIGDAKQLGSLPENCNGIYYYNNGWIQCTNFVRDHFGRAKKRYSVKSETEFIAKMEEMNQWNQCKLMI